VGHRLVDVLRSGRHVGGVWLPVTNVSSVRLSVMLPCLWGRAAMSESECPGSNLRSNPWLWLAVIVLCSLMLACFADLTQGCAKQSTDSEGNMGNSLLSTGDDAPEQYHLYGSSISY